MSSMWILFTGFYRKIQGLRCKRIRDKKTQNQQEKNPTTFQYLYAIDEMKQFLCWSVLVSQKCCRHTDTLLISAGVWESNVDFLFLATLWRIFSIYSHSVCIFILFFNLIEAQNIHCLVCSAVAWPWTCI